MEKQGKLWHCPHHWHALHHHPLASVVCNPWIPFCNITPYAYMVKTSGKYRFLIPGMDLDSMDDTHHSSMRNSRNNSPNDSENTRWVWFIFSHTNKFTRVDRASACRHCRTALPAGYNGRRAFLGENTRLYVHMWLFLCLYQCNVSCTEQVIYLSGFIIVENKSKSNICLAMFWVQL